ncbi:MCP four helix bundle domain-containing protein, partial [Wenzhouxiangella sp. XN24]|uniref:MCP four helix bundle domain-containing protein n=1 Tax=Wenzhouxiangella sp. XN24 TaxID=2713569 RepID=UPI0013ED34F6|nr:methyl-accepting chemotaxis protein [Wenzhouxiangella sp. XN24]
MNNLKIGTRLAIAFSVVVLLLVFIAATSVTRIGSLSGEIDAMAHDLYPKTTWANNVIDQVNLTAVATRNMLIYREPAAVERELARIPEASAEITRNIELLEETITSAEGKEKLAAVQTTRPVFVAALRDLEDFIRAGNTEAAEELLTGRMLEAQRDYLGAITNLIDYQSELMEIGGDRALEAAASGRVMVIGLSGAAVLVAILLAFLIARSITRPVGEVLASARKMAVGDFNFTLESDAKDEIGEVVRAVGEVQGSVKGFIGQMSHMSSEHDKGDIDVMIAAEEFEGDYRTMAEGVNGMVNGHIAVKKKAMACVAEFGRGNFEAELEKFPGKKRFINDTIEKVRENLKALIVDANMLSEAALAGKLATRADAKRHEGDFRKIVEGVNATLDAVVVPVNEVKRVMVALSEGDLTQKIQGNYQGDFKVL